MDKQDRYKTSIAFNTTNWIKLQNLAGMQNTSPTAILNDLLDAYVNEKLPDNYQERIQERVYAVLDSRIDDSTIEVLARRVVEFMGKDNSSVIDTKVTNTTSGKFDLIEDLNTTKATKTTKQNKATKTTKATKKSTINDAIYTTDATSEQDLTEAEKDTTKAMSFVAKREYPVDELEKRIEAKLAKFKQFKASDNRKGHSDAEVAAAEGLSKAAVHRYRKGKRSPSEEFRSRWGLSWNREQWIKI